jgi:hypothetical protein
MDLLLGVLVFTLAMKVLVDKVGDAISDAKYAAKGVTPPRYEGRPAGKGKPPRWGSRDYWREWRADFWEDLHARRKAKRQQWIDSGKLVPLPGERAAAAVAVGTKRAVAAVRRPPTTTDPEPATAPTPESTKTQPVKPDATSNGGKPMSQPTGEAENYETAGAELDAVLGALGRLGDHTIFLGGCLSRADQVADAYDGDRTQLAAATDQLAAALAAKKVDAGIVSKAQEVLDAVSPTEIQQLIDALAAAEAIRQKIITSLDGATAATMSAKSELDAKYGQAKELIGDTDGTFLDT